MPTPREIARSAIARATLEHDYPDQNAYLFEDLHAATGAGAIVSVTTFLDRRDVLKEGKERKDSKKEDVAAVKKRRVRDRTNWVAGPAV